MELPPPLKAQTPNSTPINPSDTTSIHGILNRFELLAHTLKFCGHSIPSRTISMIKASRQSQLSERQLDRLCEVRSHCKAVSRIMKGQPPEADPAKLKAEVARKEDEILDLRQIIKDTDSIVALSELLNSHKTSEIQDLKEQVVNLKEHVADLKVHVANLEEHVAGESTESSPACMLASSPWTRTDEDRVNGCNVWKADSVPRLAAATDNALRLFMLQEMGKDPHVVSEMTAALALKPADAKHFADFHYHTIEAVSMMLDWLARSTLDRLEAMTAYAHDLEERREVLKENGFRVPRSCGQHLILEATARHLRELVSQTLHRSMDMVGATKKGAEAYAKAKAAWVEMQSG